MRRRTLLKNKSIIDPITGKGVIDGYEVIDLGLPHGTLWAICNVGATKARDFGNYYQWGSGSTTFAYYQQQYYSGSEFILPSSVDTATQVMGNNFRTPTKGEWEELFENTTNSKATSQGVSGFIFRSKTYTNRYIFLPEAGQYVVNAGDTGSQRFAEGDAYLWTSTNARENSNGSYSGNGAFSVSVIGGGNSNREIETSFCGRGYSIRGVHGDIFDYYVDLGLPSGTLWAKSNIAKSSTGDYSFCTSVSDYGCYFTWGNIVGYNDSESHSWTSGTYSSTPGASLTSDITPTGGNDAANVHFGSDLNSNWQIPTRVQFKELYDNCTVTWISDYNGTGIAGTLFASNVSGNNKKIFLPAAGMGNNSSITTKGTRCHYWTSTWESASNAKTVRFYDGSFSTNISGNRYQGRSIRPVLVPQ